MCSISLRLAAVAATLSLCFAPSIFPQANTGTIVGTVTDSSGASIANCKITVTNTGTEVSKEANTDASGDYRISYLLPGTYDITAEAPNFRRAIRSALNLDVDQKALANFILEIGAVTEKVEVTGTAPLLQTQSVEQSQVITEKQMKELPINVRDFAQFASLQAGTVIGTGGLGNSFGGDNPQSTGGAINVNGLGQDANNWQLDGVSNNEAFFSIISVSPSLDALQEVKVTTNNYSAEFGRAGGANVQAQIKSGSNQFHGGAFEFLRNDKLDANSFFNNASGAGKNPFRQNQFGGFLGGPIKHDKTFFFVDTELLRNREASSGIITVPTALQHQGIFTEPGQPTVYNPLTHQPFPNNSIPASLINPASAAILALIPGPNIPNSGIVNNFLGVSDQAHDRSTFDIRVDQNFTEKDQLFARYSYLETTLDTPPYLGSVLNGDPFANTAYTRNQNGVVSEVHTFSPNSINEARVGVNRVRTDWDAYGANQSTSQSVGIPGINDFCGFCGGLPRISISGITVLGHTPFAPTRRHDTIWQYVDNVTLTRGHHTLKMGADIEVIQANLFQTSNPVGEFDFDKNLTSNQGSGGIGLASFLTGYYSFAGRAALQVTSSSRKKDLFFFGQDDYRIKPNLTLNLGVRYEVYVAPTDQHNRLSNFDLGTGDILVACVAVNCSGGIKTQYGNFAPRLGIAYSPGGGKTSIRLGAGTTYYSAGFGGQIGTLNDNYPWVTGQAFTPPNIYTPGPVLTGGFPPLPPVEQRPGAPAGHLIPKGGASGGGFSSVFYQPFDLKMPRVYQWSASIQRQLWKGFLADIAYVANVSNFVFLNIDGNVPLPGSDPTGLLSLQQRRPYYSRSPDMAGFTNRINAGLGRYNSMQLKVEKRFSSGFSFQSAYTVSKTESTGTESPANPFHYMVKSLAGNDVPQRLVFSYVYELPLGKGKRFGNNWNKAVDSAFGGWQLSGITNFQAGFPFNPSITSNLDNGEGNQPNRVCDGRLSNRTINRWFDTSCFVASAPNVFGNSGYNVLRGPALRDWDMTLGKTFPITERVRLQFRGDFLNIFNQVVFASPNAQVDTAGAGTIHSTLGDTFPRRIQFGLKLNF